MADTKTCPYCAEEIQLAAIVCKHCNRPLPGHEGKVPSVVAAVEQRSTEPKPRVAPLLLIFIAAAILIAGGAYVYFSGILPAGGSCSSQAAKFVDHIELIMSDWTSAVNAGRMTPTSSLAPVIERLQNIRREFAELQPPQCAQSVKDPLVRHMDKTIEGFTMSMNPTTLYAAIDARYEDASAYLREFNTELRKLKDEQPPYD